MRRLYSFLLFISLPVIFARLYFKGRLNPMYRQRWKERLAIIPEIKKNNSQKLIWIHAVSVGEVEATLPLVKKLFSEYSDLHIIMTTTTPTGAETVARRYPEQFNKQIKHFYIPYDLTILINRFIKKINPDLLIILETEVWPNLIHVCDQKNIPVLLANARMSKRSAKGYKRFSSLSQPTFSKLNAVAAQTDQDAERIISLGAIADNVVVSGSLKFDQKLPVDINKRSLELRKKLGSKRPIWIAASTHEGEEEKILAAHAEVIKTLTNCLLILVPRHPERFDHVYNLCEKAGFKTNRRSVEKNNIQQQSDNQIYMVDTMGDLLLCYGAADVAFVGGSLAEIGGHNLLEPASLGIPVIMGPHTFKIEKIFQTFVDENAAVCVNNTGELADKILKYLENDQKRFATGKRARDLVERNQGSAQRHIDLIKEQLVN
ncbi:MAG: lipid IV(A) 3-deoxy-D-manno-octulosonic acid transferase [Gammaproteobacteria bacterium]